MATFTFYVVPAPHWSHGSPTPGHAEAGPLVPLLREALVLRRRIAKGANLEAERNRYTTCLGELEGRLSRSGMLRGPATSESVQAALREGGVIGFALPDEYFDLIARAHLERLERRSSGTDLGATAGHDHGAELGSSVLPPEVLEAHAAELERLAAAEILADQPALQQLARERAGLVRVVGRLGAGIVEVVEELDNRDVAPPPERPRRGLDETPAPASQSERPATTTAKGRRKMAVRLVQAIEEALPSGGKVNFSDQPHEVSTEVLAHYLYAEPGASASRVRVVYADGSEAKTFPLRALPLPDAPTPASADPVGDGVAEIALALMSMRHLELDPIVERAWYRNKEVSQTRPLAESDDFCFAYSLRELAELREVYEGRPVLVRMYHTGFEPAALGFYRAVVAELRARRGWLRVLPHYYRGGTRFETGRVVWE